MVHATLHKFTAFRRISLAGVFTLSLSTLGLFALSSLSSLFIASPLLAQGNVPNSPGLAMRFLTLGVVSGTHNANFTNNGGNDRSREAITTATFFDDFSAEIGYAFNSTIAIHAGIYYRHVPESFDNESRFVNITAIPFGVTFYTRSSWYFSPVLFLNSVVSYAGNRLDPQGLSYGLIVGWETRISDYWSIGIAFRFWRFETKTDQLTIGNNVFTNYRRQDTIISALTLSVSYR